MRLFVLHICICLCVCVSHNVNLFNSVELFHVIVAGSSDTDEDEDDEDDDTNTSSHTQNTINYFTHMADDSATALFISNEQGMYKYFTVYECMVPHLRAYAMICWCCLFNVIW